jgi:hypothetical protein
MMVYKQPEKPAIGIFFSHVDQLPNFRHCSFLHHKHYIEHENCRYQGFERAKPLEHSQVEAHSIAARFGGIGAKANKFY